jgi:flagellin
MGIVSINTNYDALNAGRFFNKNITDLSKANAQLASGRIDSDASDAPAAAAVGANLNASILAQTQAASNVTQAQALISLAAGSLQTMTEVLQTMKARSTQANSDTIGSSQRAMLDKEYQALLSQVDTTAKISWNGQQLFTGSNSTVNRLGTLAASGTSGGTTTDVAAAYTLTGFVSGSVNDVNVKTSGENGALVNVIVGGQAFSGSIIFGQTGTVQLSSNIDSANTISLDVTGTGLTSTSIIESELNALFQLDIGNPISMRSTSTDLSTTLTSVATGAATEAGIYGLSYGYDANQDTITYKLSNGKNVWEKTFEASLSSNASLGLNTRTIVFDNGLTVKTAGSTDETVSANGVEILNISQGSQLSLSFQVGTTSADTISITFGSATTKSLGLSGTAITSKDSAVSASNAIDAALIQISDMIAQLGGTKSQMNFTFQSLELLIQNEQFAKATFTDADITTALETAQESTALVNMSSTIFQNTLQQPKKLAELVQTVMR